jgi:hypothetical protein
LRQRTENIVAEALSCLPAADDPEKPFVMPSCEELADCFAKVIEENWSFPISITSIKSCQQQDSDPVQKAASDNPACTISPFRGGTVICHKDKTVTPLPLRTHVGQWHHKMSCHPGERRAEETMRQSCDRCKHPQAARLMRARATPLLSSLGMTNRLRGLSSHGMSAVCVRQMDGEWDLTSGPVSKQ